MKENSQLKKAELRLVYEEMKKLDRGLQTCPVCDQLGDKSKMDRHHIAGRSVGNNILHYVYCCRPCHKKIHDDVEWAESAGFLWRGRNTKEITSTEWAELMSRLKIR